MNTQKLVKAGKTGAIDHLLPALGGVVAGQFLGEHRMFAGIALVVVGAYMNKPQIATAGAVAAVTPILPAGATAGVDGVDGFDIKAGQARLNAYTSQVKAALWPFSKPAAPAARVAPPAGTSGLGMFGQIGEVGEVDTVYADYSSISGTDEAEQLIGMPYEHASSSPVTDGALAML